MTPDWTSADSGRGATEAPDVTAALERLLQDEPGFRRTLDEATTAAIRDGRRRQLRNRAIGGVMSGAVAAAVCGAVVVIGPFGHQAATSVATSPSGGPLPSAVSTSSTSSTSSPSSTPAPAETTAPPETSPSSASGATGTVADRVQRLALAVAKPLGAATVVDRSAPTGSGDTAPYLTRLRVTTPKGPVEVAVSLDSDPGTSVALMSQSCQLDNGGADSGRRCTVITLTDSQGTWSRSYPNQPGRSSLEVAQTTDSGATLHVVIDNYAELANGTKAIGPTWSAAGIDPTEVEVLVRDSGLLG
ncbi:MAG: hypothetical protein ACTHMZ_13740 [Actinomycetes bacterium]